MLFTQIEFLFLFVAAFGFLLVCRNNTLRKVGLLVASYYFYAYWDYRFLALIGLSTIVDYAIGLSLVRLDPVSHSKQRKRLLILSLAINLGALGFFKYCNFFIESFRVALSPLGWNLETLNIILPVGISFYTFQTLSYTIDVYRGRLKACRSLLDFALFVSFFPQLVAGPIVRASDFLPQLETTRRLSAARCYSGFRQFTIGLFKKMFIADNLAGFVDAVFVTAGSYDALTTWLAVIAYSMQIYCDFSGYSDMAIGVARTLGYDLPRNFNWPYLATRIDDFWRRWHISLSSWLRDYLYIPLGGNRKGRARTYVNLMITMLLGGLWHGAAWTFVVWGGIHGGALAITKFCDEAFPSTAKPSLFRQALGRMVTLLIVAIAWVFFRAATFTDAARILQSMLGGGDGFRYLPIMMAIILPCSLIVHLLGLLNSEKPIALPANRVSSAFAILTMFWLAIVFHPRNFSPFIYFQF